MSELDDMMKQLEDQFTQANVDKLAADKLAADKLAAQQTPNPDEKPPEGEQLPEGEQPPEGEEIEGEDEDLIEVGGEKLSRERIAQLINLGKYLDTYPEVISTLATSRQAIAGNERYSAPIPPAQSYIPQAPEPPKELDLDDPNVKLLWDNYAGLKTSVEQMRQENLQRLQTETYSQVERATEEWNKKYKLSVMDLKDVRNRAGELSVAPAQLQAGRSVYDSTMAAMDAAFWTMPTMRDRFLSAQTDDEKRRAATDKSKQGKLNALAGRSTAPTAKVDPSKMTEGQRREAMIAELTEKLNRS